MTFRSNQSASPNISLPTTTLQPFITSRLKHTHDSAPSVPRPLPNQARLHFQHGSKIPSSIRQFPSKATLQPVHHDFSPFRLKQPRPPYDPLPNQANPYLQRLDQISKLPPIPTTSALTPALIEAKATSIAYHISLEMDGRRAQVYKWRGLEVGREHSSDDLHLPFTPFLPLTPRDALRTYTNHHRTHPHSRKKSVPADCEVCGKTIRRAADMPRHMKIHATNQDELKLYCPECNKGFLQKSNLNTHIDAKHSKIRSKKCPESGCPFATSDPGSLTRHRKRMHGYEPKARRKATNSSSTSTLITTRPPPSSTSSPAESNSDMESSEEELRYPSPSPEHQALFLSHDYIHSRFTIPTNQPVQHHHSSSDSPVPRHLEVAGGTAFDGRVFQGMQGFGGSRGYEGIRSSRFSYPPVDTPTHLIYSPNYPTHQVYRHVDGNATNFELPLPMSPTSSIHSPTSSTSSRSSRSSVDGYPSGQAITPRTLNWAL
ncbi:hypothetical protein JAAARDRAFT_210924 [Jaapia argillacea MUCL 33604]|uniref:C2H2-type domain-containing protein n=1 Tax=Jaapia argillacea MUCL 33604 TaxID=933084 RepID=A0A067PAI9_9AGAM|nr:hypothetical protein JAAARDRAFT_210924 [Jaapia argillacea MUCL 33604]